MDNPGTKTANFDWGGFDAYLFDIDGTLLNCRDWVHYDSFHTALRQVWNCDAKIETVAVHGSTDIGILRAVTEAAGTSDQDFRQRLPQAIAIMETEVERNSEQLCSYLCPSIAELLQHLQGSAKLLAVTSGNLERIGWTKLRRAAIDCYFAFGSFSDHNETRTAIFNHGLIEARRRLGTHATVCFIGDTPADVLAAKALNAPVVAVATGVYSMETLRELGPDLCLPCCDALLAPQEE